MKTNSQTYSDIVFKYVSEFVKEQGNDSKQARQYKSLAKRSGGMLRSVGLIQFLSFLAAKAGERHYKDLLNHLTRELKEVKTVQADNHMELLEKVRQQELPDYMRTTFQAIQLLQWHKRISEIMILGTAEDI